MEDFKFFRFFRFQNFQDLPCITNDQQVQQLKQGASSSVFDDYPKFPAHQKRPLTMQHILDVRKILEVTPDVLLVLGAFETTQFERSKLRQELPQYLECLFILHKSRILNYFTLHEHFIDFQLARSKKSPQELILVTLGYDFPIYYAPQNIIKNKGQDSSSFQTTIRFWNFDKLKLDLYAITPKQRHLALQQNSSSRMVSSDFTTGTSNQFPLELPRSIPVHVDSQPNLCKLLVPTLGVSQDLSIIVVALRTGEVILIRAPNLSQSSDKQRKYTFLLRGGNLYDDQIKDVTNVHIFQTKENNKLMYYIYILGKKNIVIFRATQKREQRIFFSSEFGASDGCSSVNSRGELAVAKASEQLINIFNRKGNIQASRPIDGKKRKIAYYKDNSLAVITIKDTNVMMRMFDLQNQIISFQANYGNILDIDCGLGSHAGQTVKSMKYHIFIMGEKSDNLNNKKKVKLLQRLDEFNVNEKLNHILKREHYEIAYKLALNSGFDQNYLAEISSKHADFLYNNGDFNQAIVQYKRTIGFINPSYVIQKYLQVQKLDNLIDYLQKLTQRGRIYQQDKRDDNYSIQIFQNSQKNRDYTALLLNCYVKQKKADKLKQFANKITEQSNSNSIFDVQTAIDVCRQTEGKAELAIELAQKTKQWDLTVLIMIQNKSKQQSKIKSQLLEDYYSALTVIQKKVKHVSKKISLLKQHASELLRGGFQPQYSDLLEDSQAIQGMPALLDPNKLREQEVQHEKYAEWRSHVYKLIQKIARYIINHHLSIDQPADLKKWEMPQYDLRPEELLGILIDQPLLQEKLLTFIIRNYSECNSSVYHSLIELYLRQYNESRQKQGRQLAQNQFQKEIIEFMRHFSAKCDKNHVLFLFQVYNYQHGIKEFCEELSMYQQLLNFYIQKGDNQKILSLCKDHGQQDTDLWVQALTYFVTRTLSGSKGSTSANISGGSGASTLKSVGTTVSYLDIQKALQAIGEKDLVNVSVVLQLLGKNKSLPLKCAKKYLATRMQALQKGIVKNSQKVDVHFEEIKKAKNDIYELKTQAKLFQVRNCSTCEKKLSFPTIHFLCGHCFHEECIMEQKDFKECQICISDITDKINRKQQYISKADDDQQFIHQVRAAKDKFKTVAKYYGRGLFSEQLLK